MPSRIDVTGQSFGRLTVLSDAPPSRSGRRRVLCACVCGAKTEVDPRLLRNGQTTSCGCAQKDAIKRIVKARMRFQVPSGQMPEYEAWLGMKKRCFTPNEPKYPLYGGRGITVCPTWVDDFAAFLKDVGPKPSSQHSLDRIDVNGPYSASNCRWATLQEQALNRQYHVMVSYAGERMPLSQACRLSGVKYRSAMYRLRSGRDWQQPIRVSA